MLIGRRDPATLAGAGTAPTSVAAEPVPASAPDLPRPKHVGKLPPDPVETDRALLDLTLVDEATDLPVTTWAQLWRIGAPGNGHWTAGDQLQAHVWAKEGKALVPGLPDGFYRVFAEGQRADSDDSPPFEVRGVCTQVTLRLPMPRRQTVTLRVVDENGRPLDTATLDVWTSGHGEHDLRPAWVRKRLLTTGEELDEDSRCGGCCGHGEDEERVIESTAGEYIVELLGSARDEGRHHVLEVAPARRNRVMLHLDGGFTDGETYVAVALPLDSLTENVRFPDGERARLGSAEVQARCEPRLVKPQTPPDAWRTIPVSVSVNTPGHRLRTFKATADAPSPSLTLERGW